MGMNTFPRYLDTAHKKQCLENWEWMNEREGLWTLRRTLPHKDSNTKRCHTILSILTSHLLAPVARQRISRLFVPGAGSVFSLQANAPQGSAWNRSETTTFSVVSARLFCSTSENNSCVHIYLNTTSLMGNAPLFRNKVSNRCVHVWKCPQCLALVPLLCPECGFCIVLAGMSILV